MILVRKLKTILLISLFVLITCEYSIADNPPIPGIPHAFWGTVTYESGENVSDGIKILAVVDGENYNTTVKNGTYGYYTPFHVEDPEGNNHGLPISFYVDGIFTGQIATFESGATRLNLTVSKTSDNGGANDDSSNNNGGGDSGTPPPVLVSPTAVISAKTYAFVNVSMDFDASNSTDDGDIITYSWDFGDGSVGSGITVSHLFNKTGTFNVSLLVTDDDALTDIDEISVSVMLDSDADQWGDKEEDEYGTDPENSTDYPLDTDNDHFPDEIDTDDDNDGVVDAIELELGSNRLDKSDVIKINGNKTNGFLVNVDNDSIFDFFVGSSMEDYSEIELDDDGYYLLDVNFDGRIDYRYNVETGELVEYQQPFNIMDIGIFLLVLIIIGFLVFFGIYRSKRSGGEK